MDDHKFNLCYNIDLFKDLNIVYKNTRAMTFFCLLSAKSVYSSGSLMKQLLMESCNRRRLMRYIIAKL